MPLFYQDLKAATTKNKKLSTPQFLQGFVVVLPDFKKGIQGCRRRSKEHMCEVLSCLSCYDYDNQPGAP